MIIFFGNQTRKVNYSVIKRKIGFLYILCTCVQLLLSLHVPTSCLGIIRPLFFADQPTAGIPLRCFSLRITISFAAHPQTIQKTIIQNNFVISRISAVPTYSKNETITRKVHQFEPLTIEAYFPITLSIRDTFDLHASVTHFTVNKKNIILYTRISNMIVHNIALFELLSFFFFQFV